MAIVFRQKEFGPSSFSNLDDFVESGRSNSGGGYLTIPSLNILKSIEMWSYLTPHETSHVPHWINDMVVSEVMLKLINSKIPPQIVFAPFEEDEKTIRKIFGDSTAEKLISSVGIGKDFYKTVKTRLLSEIKRGSGSVDPKYSAWFKDNPIWRSEEDYLLIFKYISLCLSGQLDPEVDDISNSSCYKKIIMTDVNYSKIFIKSQKRITKLIIKCIENINGFILKEVENGLSVLNYKS